VNTIDTAPIDTSTPVQPATPASPQDQQQTGQDAAPTGVAEAFAALLAGIVATPVAPAAGPGTAIAEVAPAAETAAVATTTAPPTAPAIAPGPATAVPSHDAIAADSTIQPDGTAPVTTAAPADAPAATAEAPAAPAAPTPPAPGGTVAPIDGPSNDGPGTTPVTAEGDTPEAPASTTGTSTTTASPDATAPAAAAPEVAAMQAATVVAPAPDGPAPVAGDIRVTVAPTPSTPVDGDTTSDPGVQDGKPGSEPATQAPPPAASVSHTPDAATPAAGTTAVDAAQAPSLVVPTPAATVPVAATSELPQSLTTDRERFVRLVDGLEARLRVSGAEGGRAMSMTLRPAELGDVTVRLHIAADGQSATATLLAQHHQTGDLLAQAAGDLRQALADRGLRLDRLEVTAGPLGGDAPSDGAPSGAPNPGKQDTRRTHYAFDARSDFGPELPGSEAATGTTHEGLYVLA
jgi:flagellar hook-length control protein FliK